LLRGADREGPVSLPSPPAADTLRLMPPGPATTPAPKQHPALEALENAPIDDEPVTEDEERDIAEAREAVRRGEVLTHEEVRKLWLGEP